MESPADCIPPLFPLAGMDSGIDSGMHSQPIGGMHRGNRFREWIPGPPPSGNWKGWGAESPESHHPISRIGRFPSARREPSRRPRTTWDQNTADPNQPRAADPELGPRPPGPITRMRARAVLSVGCGSGQVAVTYIPPHGRALDPERHRATAVSQAARAPGRGDRQPQSALVVGSAPDHLPIGNWTRATAVS